MEAHQFSTWGGIAYVPALVSEAAKISARAGRIRSEVIAGRTYTVRTADNLLRDDAGRAWYSHISHLQEEIVLPPQPQAEPLATSLKNAAGKAWLDRLEMADGNEHIPPMRFHE